MYHTLSSSDIDCKICGISPQKPTLSLYFLTYLFCKRIYCDDMLVHVKYFKVFL